MHFQFQVAPPSATIVPDNLPSGVPPESTDLLRQLLEVQREQTQLLRFLCAAHDSQTRWRNFLARWSAEFPQVGGDCKSTLPMIERAYMTLIADLTEHLRSENGEPFDNEFALSEFLDRYGIRLGQLGSILSMISPIAEAARTEEG